MKVKFSAHNLLLALMAISIIGCTNGRIKTGDKMYDNLSYSKAVEKYEKALKSRPDDTDLKLKLANAHRNLNNSADAEMYYRQVSDSIGLQGEDQVYYAQALMKNNKYEEAKGHLESYLKENPNDQLAKDLLGSTKAVDELKEDTAAYMLTPLPLDFTVSMFGPAHYGKGLVFAGETEITSAASTNPWTGYSFLDLFYIEKDKDGFWDIPVIFSEVLNGKFHDGPATFNGAEDMVVYTRSAMKNEKKQLVNDKRENQFYLYMSNKTDDKWSEPRELPFNDPRYSVGHPALSADGKTLYFSSDMAGGYGGSDIYISNYDGETWSEPVNAGSTINTPGNEVFPYVAKDGRLYFSSEGHQTLGGLDVFVSTEKGGVWSQPVNLAYPLNSSQDDFAYIVNDDDTTGFVSSNRSGIDMIYGYTKMSPIFILDGMASLKSENAPIEGVLITLINMTDGDTARVTTTENGKFKFNLLPEKKYKVMGEKPGYFNLSEEFQTGKKSLEKKIAFGFEIDEIVESTSGTGSGDPKDGSDTAAKVYEIGEVFYDYDKATIRPDAEPKLNKLATLLKDNPSVSIEVQSHSDSRGSDAYNVNLSNRRAQAVVNYLVGKGIAKSRLKSKGFGESQPVNKCVDGVECTEAEHQQNRRTEFIVLKSGNS
jgi:outer membrane protein OmpA-like peptidoglycan-associated protein/tetratricopeptide (TPR) repeat protein